MVRVNLVKFASELAKAEGLKKQVSIGNVREVMKLIFKKLKTLTVEQLMDILKRY